MTIILLGLTLVSCVAMIFTMIIMITIMTTWPKPAYGQQGLDWIVGPEYSIRA